MKDEKVTTVKLRAMKESGDKIAAVTAYDHPFALLADMGGADVILVGDSLGMAVRGEENTLKVTIEDMAYHTRAVRRGVQRALLVADMPFLSYHLGADKAMENAGRLVAEGAEAVKLEGAGDVAKVTGRMVAAGIPVMGHVGLTPQSIHQLGGFRMQGKGVDTAKRISDEAVALEAAGAFAIVLECVPMELAQSVTAKLKIPTIGIGAGPGCDGQILVINDLLGMPSKVTPKFVKKYADLSEAVTGAVRQYVDEVRAAKFPAEEHSYTARPRHLKAI
ncbi:MAG: 3-methyl-2-oxobutanoate hydroxymethyltransferase [Nitrospinae bacterium]|nr:3-methyl-2-oxobutanoate hydroxymethyltransferase [Nitrospinota bacterium]